MNSENKAFLEKTTKVTGKILKGLCTVGNYVVVGAVFGACIAFPPLALPLKVCAGVSMAAIGDMLTIKTDEYIDDCVKEANEAIQKLDEAFSDIAEESEAE